MKKILIFLVLITAFTSCYDEFRLDNEYSSVAFSSADGGSNEIGVLWRTAVKGEGLNVNAGIYLAGILDNGKERWFRGCFHLRISQNLKPSKHNSIRLSFCINVLKASVPALA